MVKYPLTWGILVGLSQRAAATYGMLLWQRGGFPGRKCMLELTFSRAMCIRDGFLSFPANGISVGWLLEACFLLQNPHCLLHVSLIHIHLLLAHKFSLLNINISLRFPASISTLPLDTQLLMYSPLPPDDTWICPQGQIETGLCSILWYWQEVGPFALVCQFWLPVVIDVHVRGRTRRVEEKEETLFGPDWGIQKMVRSPTHFYQFNVSE